MHNGRKIITLCGSTKFKPQWEAAMKDETMQGHIVIGVGCFGHADDIDHSESTKRGLDRLHFDKIDLSDEIFIINVDGYVGESTTNEIACAIQSGKGMRWLEPEAGEEWLENNSHKLGQIVSKFMTGEPVV